ncbi:MAG: phage head-tail connector protein [Natronohydrobacter sp.]|nr:phage head-tail connector protein [Natronohydrobacter sp.]
MMHIQRLTRPALPLDLSETKLFLRVDSDIEDLAIQALTDAAAHEIEDTAEIALVNQVIRVTLDGWPDTDRLRLPIGPVFGSDPTFQVMADGEQIEADLITGKRPVLVLASATPEALRNARVVIEYEAGFGSTSADLPPDIAHAIRDQVAQSYDWRGGHAGEGKAGQHPRGTSGQSYALQRVIGRYRGVRA